MPTPKRGARTPQASVCQVRASLRDMGQAGLQTRRRGPSSGEERYCDSRRLPSEAQFLLCSLGDRKTSVALSFVAYTDVGIQGLFEWDGPGISGLPSAFPDGEEGICRAWRVCAALGAHLHPSCSPLVHVGAVVCPAPLYG